MKKKKTSELMLEILTNEYKDLMLSDNIIIAKRITKNEGKALYYNAETGIIFAKDIDFRDTHKYETDNYKLMRFRESYLKSAKSIALDFMNNNSLGYSLYTESGFYVG